MILPHHAQVKCAAGVFLNVKPRIMENKYKEGEIVYAKVNPEVKLVIRRYVDKIYYCKFPDEPARKELVYFEREILPFLVNTET